MLFISSEQLEALELYRARRAFLPGKLMEYARICRVAMPRNIAASGRQKLLNKSREEKRPFRELLQRLQHIYGFNVQDCYSVKPEDLNDGSHRSDKRNVIFPVQFDDEQGIKQH